MHPNPELSSQVLGSKSVPRLLSFRPRARLVSVLGEHLISDQAVGLIELVKNSYDADATEVVVELLDLPSPESTTVVVRDNGTGMTTREIEEKWLSPAVDHKEKAKREHLKSPLGRLPIGEKGVGRFAVHQIGRSLELVTRAAGQPEIFIPINWDNFETGELFLDAVNLTVHEREPLVFTQGTTGTQIKIKRARCLWTRSLLEKVHRTFRRLQSPVWQDERTGFKLIVTCPEYPEFENLDSTDILEKSHYKFRALVDAEGRCDFEYHCNHPGTSSRTKSDTVELVPMAADELHGKTPACGPFWINLYVWDRTKDYLTQSNVSIKELNAQCGVSLFRDHLRVLPYGDPGNDWLLLDQERIQDPSGKIGNNQVIGVIEVLQEDNLELRDTTNREGLIENDAFQDLRALTRAAIKLFTTYWKKDRPPAREHSSNKHGTLKTAKEVATALQDSASEDVEVELSPSLAGKDDTDTGGRTTITVSQRKAVNLLIDNLDGAVASDRDKEKQIERLLMLAGTGLAAERVVHEFGRQVAAAYEAVNQLRRLAPVGSRSLESVNLLGSCLDTLKSEFRILAPYESVDRTPKATLVSVRDAAEIAVTLNRRFIDENAVQVQIYGEDFELRARQSLLVQIMDNLVNNACYWLSASQAKPQRLLQILLDRSQRQVLVMDNGPGVHEEANEHLFEPFFSMKSGGSGLGLYISREVAKRLPGDLRMLTAEDERVDPKFSTGACFLLDLNGTSRR